MASPPPAGPVLEPNVPEKLDPVAGLLSYLIPGLGQISQGRVGKGLMFFFGLYALFFYGMMLGKWTNVYLPSVDENQKSNMLSRLLNDLYARPHFAGQFFIGIAAWPAVHQYRNFDESKEAGPTFGKFQRAPHNATELQQWNDKQRDENKRFDLGGVCTVIAGVLNILVIYDALAGPAFREVKPKTKAESEPAKEPQPAAPLESATP